MLKTMRIIDPPGGWRYGFPKLYNPKQDETLAQWLVREGYPPQEVEWAINHLRTWEAPVTTK